MTDRTLERTNPDWSLYVADFDDWVSARLHVRPTARLKVEQQKSRQGDLVWIAFGPHAQLFLPRPLARQLFLALGAVFKGVLEYDRILSDDDSNQIKDKFSAGASGGASPLPTAAPGVTAPAPAEPSKSGDCER